MAYIEINDGVNGFDLEIPIGPDSDRSMGRPPLGMKPTTIRLTTDTIRRIESLVGNRRLALFIREAVENELKRRENPEALQGQGNP
ncbi:hypothetical protein PMI04_013775 [Sphingobium sp. AP49]|uniref:hypothetical protein n=1 Tax=Sphingobium sp. AP49 TaxID=1144307 RepID=UPI00026EE319|nr:hypothetical protein [Sphingobium sp. AP49]WHO37631.1 hypothetical protein PMI04_013775 [Sphingobium sp. AP49]